MDNELKRLQAEKRGELDELGADGETAKSRAEKAAAESAKAGDGKAGKSGK